LVASLSLRAIISRSASSRGSEVTEGSRLSGRKPPTRSSKAAIATSSRGRAARSPPAQRRRGGSAP
jgi:hypothetical protein